MDELDFCIEYLKKANGLKDIPYSGYQAFRALLNVTMPVDLSNEFYECQDKVLQELLAKKKVVDINNLAPIDGPIVLYQGDITTIKADCIVNACNCYLLGCFVPLHNCIDNAIHSAAGLQVRRDLMVIMARQGHNESNGQAKITKGYNLPSSYILHTVGPEISGEVGPQDEEDLRSCYVSCLDLAKKNKLRSIVFCCISTGIYGYPKLEAAKMAVTTVKEYLKNNPGIFDRVIFNVFSNEDKAIYERVFEGIIR